MPPSRKKQKQKPKKYAKSRFRKKVSHRLQINFLSSTRSSSRTCLKGWRWGRNARYSRDITSLKVGIKTTYLSRGQLLCEGSDEVSISPSMPYFRQPSTKSFHGWVNHGEYSVKRESNRVVSVLSNSDVVVVSPERERPGKHCLSEYYWLTVFEAKIPEVIRPISNQGQQHSGRCGNW